MKFVNITKQALEPKTINIVSNPTWEYDHEDKRFLCESVNLNALKESIKLPPRAINIRINPTYLRKNPNTGTWITQTYLTEALLRAITPAYLRGSEITINDIKQKPCTCNPQYFFNWTQQIPSKLPEHLKQAHRAYQLKGTLYDELVQWNQKRIQLAKEYSQFKWEIAEQFYKDLFKQFKSSIQVHSPNKKTFYEATAELAFEDIIQPTPGLTDEEQNILNTAQAFNFIQAFGLQDPTVRIGTKHRTTPHGTTDEPCIVDDSAIDAQVTASFFARKSGNPREGYINDDGFEVFNWTDTRSTRITLNSKLRENIETLKFFYNLPQQDKQSLLLAGWHFCKCGCAIHESMTRCEHCNEWNTEHPCYELHIKYNQETDGDCFVPFNENHGDDTDDFEN